LLRRSLLASDNQLDKLNFSKNNIDIGQHGGWVGLRIALSHHKGRDFSIAFNPDFYGAAAPASGRKSFSSLRRDEPGC
jgi:hypothetical protein